MATFEISVNGERRFMGNDVTAITVVSDWVERRLADRVSVHVGVGGPGEREVQYLGSDLRPGDEISTMRLLSQGAARGCWPSRPQRCRDLPGMPARLCGHDTSAS
jgi:hypothetical protein